MSRTPATLSVAEVLAGLDRAIASAYSTPLWIRGEVSGLNRTHRGAVFFRLVDTEDDQAALEVAGRGRLILDIERALDAAGVGRLRNGVELRVRGTVGLDRGRSQVRLALLEVDPAFTVGRLELDRREVLRRLAADGALAVNKSRPVPLVPLAVGLVTSRGSAAHADFVQHLGRSGYRFRVSTVHASMQGEHARSTIARAFRRLAIENVDVVALVRGGGSKLDLSPFDSEEVGRAIATTPVPVIAGVGHETDRSVADEAAAVSVKTPTDAAEWLVARVSDYASRVDTARRVIAEEARAVCGRSRGALEAVAGRISGAGSLLERHRAGLDHLAGAVASEARRVVAGRADEVERLAEGIATLGVDATLKRGFAVVLDRRGRVVRRSRDVAPGDRLSLRLADGTVTAVVEETS